MGKQFLVRDDVSGSTGYIEAGQAGLALPVVTSSQAQGGLLDAKLRFGLAAGNSAAANDAALASALAAATSEGYRGIYVPGAAADYQISQALKLTTGIALIGEAKIDQSSGGTVIRQTDVAKAVIELASDSSGAYQLQEGLIDGIIAKNGLHGLFAPNGGLGLRIGVFKSLSAVQDGIHADGFTQEWVADFIECSGAGRHGIYFTELAGVASVTSPGYHDKHRFGHLYLNGSGQDGFRWACQFANSNEIGKIVMAHNAHNGLVIAGGHRSLLIATLNSEKNGYLNGATYIPATTGSMTSGSNTVTVASAANLAAGMPLTVQGAGANGVDLAGVIASSYVSGTSVPLTTDGTTALNASTTVTSLDVTTAIYDDVTFEAIGAGLPADIRFLNCQLGATGGSVPYQGNIRYGINGQINGAGIVNLIVGGSVSPRPVYDPRSEVHTEGDRVAVRRGALAASQLRGAGGSPTVAAVRYMPSSPGGDLVLVLRDSDGSGTGTRGLFRVRKFDANRTELMSLGDTGALSVRNSIRPKVKAGGTADADFDATPADGTLGFNTNAGRIEVRNAGSWCGVSADKPAATIKTGAYSMSMADGLILADATSAAFTVTLPDISVSANSGKVVRIKKVDASANVVTVDGFGAQTIDGAATKALSSQWQCVTLEAWATAWYVID